MERRDFIKNTCKVCLGIAASTAIISFLEGCATMPVYKTKTENGLMVVPIEQFAATNIVLVRNPQIDYDILVVKKDDGTYKSLLMRCSHQDQPLSATNTGLYCTAHGSTFDLEGNVTKEPASAPLTSFRTELVNQSINIYIKK